MYVMENLGKVWSKSIVLENKVVVHFDLVYFINSWFTLVYHKLDQKPKYFRGGFLLGYAWPLEGIGGSAGNPPKKVSFRKCVFWGLRLSLGHFGQRAPESPVS